MTADQHPIADASVFYLATWVPPEDIGHVPAGVEFDAVRVKGLLGHELARALDIATSRRAGPVILEDSHGDDTSAYLYFLVEPGQAISRRWPPGIRVFGFPEQEIRVPALTGNTRPLRWRSKPTQGARLVDADLLHRALCEITTWSPLPDTA